AHKSLPFGTVVRVTRTDTGASVRVVINDRGPVVEGRFIDLARAPARRIDMLRAGVVPVELTVVGCRRRYDRCPQP
ncbi:MAG: RlpA-like double-psi beta-barrel domain-containing protein, partial [Myxococcota bacterium]|nr:RlpA-like double-psi beta-barrel domain-containing protein [Myxococcota bacterium]